MNEFELIKTFFHNTKNQSFAESKNIALGMGDDAAVFNLTADQQLVSSLDTLVENVHFPENSNPEDIAYKALAVNLSDLAAMGAAPHSFVLSITLPKLDKSWLSSFSNGLFSLANQHEIVLLGGDTSKGSLSISIQINGTVEKNKFLTRSAVRNGDLLCVTGYLGLAAAGLKQWQVGDKELKSEALNRFLRPQARIEFSQQLFGLGIRSCIDISDGLISEISHLCRASQLGVKVDLGTLLIHSELKDVEVTSREKFMLSGGDDYELCFSVPKDKLDCLESYASQIQMPLTVIGEFVNNEAFEVCDSHGKILNSKSGYTHF